MNKAIYFIEKLNLRPHPEGGYYREVFRASLKIRPQGYKGERNVFTSIYFLLDEDDTSHFHRLKSDEVWYYQEGGPLTVCIIDNSGMYKEVVLGKNIEKGEQLQIIIEAGSIFGAYHPDETGFTLMGCMVSPGFDFEDFELLERDELTNSFPDFIDIIKKLT